MRDAGSHKLRPYLISVGDEEALRDWDLSQMKSKNRQS